MNFVVTQEQKLGTSGHHGLCQSTAPWCRYKYVYMEMGGTFFVPIMGILTTNFAPNCSFLKCRKGYVIGFEQFSSPKGGEFDQKILKNSNNAPLPTIPPSSLCKDWHLHNDNIFLIIFALAEFTNLIQSYPRMCLHHCHKNHFLPNSSLCAFYFLRWTT